MGYAENLSDPIYMDHHSTTPCDPRVEGAMAYHFSHIFGNPASSHGWGEDAQFAVKAARAEVAKLLGASPREIVFTSGATEAVNLALKGLVEANEWEHKDHIVTVKTEHKAVLKTCEWLARQGMSVTSLDVDSRGLLDPGDVSKAITPRTLVVSVMAANNEIGVLHPLTEIGRICREREVYFMSDATQAVGKVPFDVRRADLDLACLSGHKMYGPKGIGALYMRRGGGRRVRLAPQIHGGDHEQGLRSGTLNVPAIAGLGTACTIARLELGLDALRVLKLRDMLLDMLLEGVPEAKVHGSLDYRLPHNLNISFPGVAGESLVSNLNGIALSAGSACMAVAREPSHVIRALGVDEETAFGAVRFGLGKGNTEEEVGEVSMRVIEMVHKLRAA